MVITVDRGRYTVLVDDVLVTAMRARARELCDPPPPGYSFTSTVPTTLVRDIETA